MVCSMRAWRFFAATAAGTILLIGATARAADEKTANRAVGRPQLDVPPPRDHTGLKPLDEMCGQDNYKGEDGGLYGGGRNTPPAAHLSAYLEESRKIRPRDNDGKPSDNGKIVLLSVGMSNTMIEYSQFKQTADADPQKSDRVVVVDGAKGARTGLAWALDGLSLLPESEQKRLPRVLGGNIVKKGYGDTWSTVAERLKAADVTPQQVQAVWIKQAEGYPARFGDFPAHAQILQANIVAILNIAKHLRLERFGR